MAEAEIGKLPAGGFGIMLAKTRSPHLSMLGNNSSTGAWDLGETTRVCGMVVPRRNKSVSDLRGPVEGLFFSRSVSDCWSNRLMKGSL